MITDTQYCKDFHLDLDNFRIAYQMILENASSAQIMEETGLFYTQISKVNDWLIMNSRMNCDFIKELKLNTKQTVMNDLEISRYKYDNLSAPEKKIYHSLR